jgi:hypothetical protein
MISTPEDDVPQDSWFSEPDREFASEQAAINHAAKLLRDGEYAWIDVCKPHGDSMVYDYHIDEQRLRLSLSKREISDGEHDTLPRSRRRQRRRRLC